MARRSGLGKGLDALFEDNGGQKDGYRTISIDEVEPNKNQPRKHFDEESITSLCESVREHGIIQPLLIKPISGSSDGGYRIVAGERRYRAARMAGIKEVPVVILDLTEKEAAEISLIENLQREDLNPIEEAEGYARLMEEFGLTQEETADRIGKSRSAVANTLRLLNLPERVLELVKGGDLTSGQARALLAFGDDKKIEEMATETVKRGLTVRTLENMAKNKAKGAKKRKTKPVDNFYSELELSFKEETGRRIKIDVKSKDKGVLKVNFYNKDELLDIVYRLANAKGDFR